MLIDGLGDDACALGVGVNAVGLVEVFDSGDAVEEEGDEYEVILFSERGEDFHAGALIVCAGIGRGEHACEQDLCAACARAFDDLGEVLARLGGGQAAQDVVCAEFEDDETHVAFERPVETAQAACGRIARNSRVDHFVFKIIAFELFL